MQQNNIHEAKQRILGFLLRRNKLQGRSQIQKNEVENIELLRASGNFKFGGEDLWGNLNIFTAGRKPISGTLHKGIAKDGLTIKLKFVP